MAQEVDGQMIWEGALTKLIASQGLSNPYYTAVRRGLMAMDCIVQVRRGGGGQPSTWALLQEPTLQLWRGSESPGHKPYNSNKKLLEQNQKQLLERVEMLEAQMRALLAGRDIANG